MLMKILQNTPPPSKNNDSGFRIWMCVKENKKGDQGVLLLVGRNNDLVLCASENSKKKMFSLRASQTCNNSTVIGNTRESLRESCMVS